MNELTSREITAFHEGTLSRLNPDLEIDEQAHLLPYNKCFEFPREKLTLGKQLGNGAFGVVVKAEAQDIIEDEPTTTVAVKMVKSHADISHLRALMTELKILMYIGQHLNVLNLLGACTLNLIQRIEVSEDFLEKLLDGYRMAKPEFCPDEMYVITPIIIEL
ncbi:hypothetical protein J437_LFUL017705 [Ladona fulva]|uniref:Protein kinase domain-containing protein n=1 Tax=Ladona fulva TaxID=123851 RepID=A0A8K0KN52_LADFU|nr:hypothetical protein J437_LFUL017705 [Ladona fulva]